MKQITSFACDYCSYSDPDAIGMGIHERDHVREKQERVCREATGQLTIKHILDKCQDLPNLPVVISCPNDSRHHLAYPSDVISYRGYYDELAIESSRDKVMCKDDFQTMLEESLTRTYYGWKGGEYDMYPWTFVWISECGVSSGAIIIDVGLSLSGEKILLMARNDNKDF